MHNMQTVMHALCRHVPKSGLQTDTNFRRVGTCSYFYTRSAQLVFCCETCPKTRIKATGRKLLSGREFGTLTIEGPTCERYIRTGTIRCFFSDCEAGESKLIPQVFVEANLSIGHHTFGSIYLVELDNQEHIQHCKFLDCCDGKVVDKIDRNAGTKLSGMEALGLAAAIPTCGSEAAVAQELQ